MTNSEAKEQFLSYAKEIKEMGYRVFVSTRENSFHTFYGWIVNEKDEIGYFQYEPYRGIKLSTIHKPGRFGTGFTVGNPDGQYVFSKKLIEMVFSKCPSWVCSLVIVKWTATEYFNHYWDKENVVQI